MSASPRDRDRASIGPFSDLQALESCKMALRLLVLATLMVTSVGCVADRGDPGIGAEGTVRRPNILIYLVDTLRADRLGCYGYERPTSPNLDAFAQEATLFETAIGQSSWTRASVASMFTGVWPPTHGATGWKHQLPEEFDTLVESLDTAGYQTAAFVGNPQITVQYGFGQGFDRFAREIKRPSAEYNQMAAEWLDSLSGEDPWFIYIHTMDPHAPYRPDEPYLSAFAPNDDAMPTWKPRWKWPLEVLPFFSDRYDGEIAQNDASFGELLGILRERGLYEDALIVFTSDHGEEFKEHGRWRHGENLHAETLNVPLIIRFPSQSTGKRVSAAVQHIDLMPTILAYVELETPDVVQGRSLLGRRHLKGQIYSHLFLSGFPLYHSLVEGDWKLIRRIDEDGTETLQLYNWVQDPGETNDLAAEESARVASLAELLEEKLAREGESPAAEEIPLSEELEEELQALGYLQ